MSSPLHRSNDWDQGADRHTRLKDPVVTVRRLGRLGLPGTSPTRIDHTLVYTTRQGSFEVFLPPHRPRRILRRYTAVYEVDMGVHAVRTRVQLPSIDDAHEFEVSVELDWQVTDPARFVRSGHRDVPRLLLGELEQAARPVTRRFPISDSANAEAEVLAVVGEGKPLGEEAGLRTLWTVRLRRDEEGIAHAQRLRAIEQASTEEVLTQQGGARADLEKATRAQAQQRHRLELQGYEAQRIDFYREYLTRGGIDAWAMHLTQHPQDSVKAMNSLREEQHERLQAQMVLIKEMLTKAGTEPFELEGPRRLAIEAFSAVFGQGVPLEQGPRKSVAKDTESSTEPDPPFLLPQPAAGEASDWQPVAPPDPHAAPEEPR
ncbi:hypothetical protein BCL76_102233 [Streptomyces sp. CG 926]|uniref:hypothetical protein n=1 Tax=Streptomyces sp. CG 926 TaxID=1882405 RepID=UPI000D6ACBDE|nr:hypothetical protein [Streptomyces sp. CG 926]PWK73209.1 hypothetical protein BCL76_102233 [Streptomyces sp. CG 926]